MISKDKINLPNICSFFIILYLYWALWKEFSFSEIVYNASVLLVFAYAFFYLISKEWKASLWMEVFCLLVWCLLMYLAYDNSDYSLAQKTVTFFGLRMDSHARIMIYLFLTVIPGVIFSSYYEYKDGKLFKMIILIIVLTSLYFSVKAVIVFPDALRARRTTEYLGYEDILYGTPTYSIVYAICLIAPWFLAKASDAKGIEKWFHFSVFVCICIIVAISQFATALLALFLGISVYWLTSNKKAKGYIFRVIIIALIVALLLVRSPLVWLFNSLSDSVTGAWSEKLSDIAAFFEGEGAVGDLATRASLYGDSLQAFLGSPIFGKMLGLETGEVGGHSTILDVLAMTGVFGAAFFVAAIFAAYKRMRSDAQNNKYIAVANAVVVSYVFLLVTKNILTALSVNFAFFVLMPMLFTMKESSENECIEEISL